MQRRLFFWSLFMFAIIIQPGLRAQAFSPPIHAHFTGTVSPAVQPGKTALVTVQATIDPGWHLYSVVPSPGGPFPTTLDAAGPGWKPLGKPTENPPIHIQDPNFGMAVAYHEGTATFQQHFRVLKATPKPTITVHFQTCNNSVCLPPAQATIPLTITATPPPAISAVSAARVMPPPASSPPLHSSSDGLGLFLLAAFAAGLLTLLTPCVFPLIPITLTSFIKQADGDRGRLVRLAGGYATGIVVLYVGLGVLVTALAGAAGLNKLGANPWINLLIFALFVVFALSFFETITIPLPVNLGAIQSAGRRHGGWVGLALLGIAFVLASFTCIAPFVGTLLVASAGGPALRPTLGLLAFALAFAAPFFLFALFPQWIERLPRSGPWLARIKATLGFVELAASLKFLSNADLYWHWKILTQPVLLTAWAVIFAGAALYLLGVWRFGMADEPETTVPGRALSPGRRVAAGVFIFAAGYCVWGLSGRPINLLATYLPPAGYGGAAQPPQTSLTWQTSYSAALAEAQAQNKPLLIDFTGYFCTNCRYNENNVFPKRDVQNQLQNFVRVQLYTDGQGDAANQRLELTKFHDISLPLYGVLDPQTAAPIAQVAGVQTPSTFAQFLSHARETAVASR